MSITKRPLQRSDGRSRKFVRRRWRRHEFVGIADAGGLENLVPMSQVSRTQLFTMTMRAKANRSRDAVLFFIRIPPHVAEQVYKRIGATDFAGALQALKMVDKVGFPPGDSTEYAESWKRIPRTLSKATDNRRYM